MAIRVKNLAAKSFIERCMQVMQVTPKHATQLADVLVEADYRGHFSHGLNRLEMYVNDQRHGMTANIGEPELIKERASTGYVDGRNLLGPVVGNYCMQIAIDKAKRSGIGMVTAKSSNHFGIAGWYSLLASREGLLGLTFTNSSPLQVATRGKQPVLGTNPISLSAPSKDPEDNFLLDMATSAVALGKLELAKVKGADIPTGWAVDSKGVSTTDPTVMLGGQGALLPLGGNELNSGYKGYGLAMLVEIFTGIMSDSKYGSNIRSWKLNDRVADLGQCFIAIDPDAFAPGFKHRLSDLMEMCRQSVPVDPENPVLVAGDPERLHMQMCDNNGGIPYHRNVIDIMDKLSNELKVEKII